METLNESWQSWAIREREFQTVLRRVVQGHKADAKGGPEMLEYKLPRPYQSMVEASKHASGAFTAKAAGREQSEAGGDGLPVLCESESDEECGHADDTISPFAIVNKTDLAIVVKRANHQTDPLELIV